MTDTVEAIVAEMRDRARITPTGCTSTGPIMKLLHGYADRLQSAHDAGALRAEVERLTGCLAQANAGFEEYERKFYLTQDRAESAESRLREAERDATRLRSFAQEVMEEWNQGDLDGGSRQDIAEKHGLLAPVTVFAPCSEDCACSEYHDLDDWALGQTCYRETPLLKGRAMEGEDG